MDSAATVVSGGSLPGGTVTGDIALFTRPDGGSWTQVYTKTVLVEPNFTDTLDQTFVGYLDEGSEIRMVYQTRNNGRTTYLDYTGYFNARGGGMELDSNVNISDYFSVIFVPVPHCISFMSH